MTGENVEIRTLERKDLINGVIAKHKRFIEEYKGEFKELDEKITSLNEQADSAIANKESVVERVDVLKEKRQQLYHQAENLLGDLSSFDDIVPEDNKLIHSINDGLVKIKPSTTLADEKQIVDDISGKLSKVSLDKEDVKKLILQIKARVDEALASSVELNSITGSDKKFNDSFFKLNLELKEILPRYGWLKTRIESHTVGLKYWEDAASGKVVTLDEAVGQDKVMKA
ncbi:MAG: hypothetical protein K0A90_06740 [Methanosarcinaceae archaeon]|nr:hypothetical protein [Methanosarcinaceae archaeon]